GSNVVGLEAAAWGYFGRSPQQLSWAETATLAVLPNAPGLIHPGRNRDRLLAKRNLLLDKLAAKELIDRRTAELAKMEPLPDKPHPLPQLAPHLLARFIREQSSAPDGAHRIETSVNGTLQQQVTDILQRYQD